MTDEYLPASTACYRARWVVPVSSPPVENGRVLVQGGMIVAVEKARASLAGVVDLGDTALLPGLINAHTHLSLTGYHGRVPFDGSFTGWIERLVALRREPENTDREIEALDQGVRLSRRAGVAALCDIGYGPDAVDVWRGAPLAIAGCLEVLGIGGKAADAHPAGLDSQLEQLDRFAVSTAKFAEALTRLGLSPHAPYSTATETYRRVVEYARRTGCPVTTHLAETKDELQFLRDGTGPFRELLEKWGLWDDSFRPPACSPVQYAHGLGLLALQPVLAHVNYADDTDLDLLTQSGAHVAYCPRTHAFFEHDPHRYVEMVRRGINVCLGTDSLASNDTLSVLDELRFLRQHASPLNDHELLELATINSARALRLDHALGTLEPGKRADIAVIPMEKSKDTWSIFDDDAPPVAIIERGSLHRAQSSFTRARRWP